MGQTYIFSRVKWRSKPPSVQMYYSGMNSEKLITQSLNFGDSISLKVKDGFYCMGSDYDKGIWLTCVANQKINHIKNELKRKIVPQSIIEQNPLEISSEKLKELDIELPEFNPRLVSEKALQCSLCKSSEYFTCRMFCRGDVCIPTSEKARKLCDPPNTSVYLTFVGGKVKVGVSLGVKRRWIEQGSDLAVEVAKAPGLEARRIEHNAAEKLDIQLSVRNMTKLNNIDNIDLQFGRKQLEKKTEEIKPIIMEVLENIEGEVIENPKIVDLTDNYGAVEFDRPVQEIQVEPGVEFGGIIVSVKGSIIVVKQNGYYYAMDLRKLKSYSFSLLDRQAKMKTQSFIDDWF